MSMPDKLVFVLDCPRVEGLSVRSFELVITASFQRPRNHPLLLIERVESSATSGVIQKGVPDEEVLGELLTLDATSVARGHAEARVQQPRDCLDAVKLAVAIEGEANNVASVLLMPGDTGARIEHRLRRLGEDLVEKCATAREHHPLAQVRAHVEGNAFVGFSSQF